MSADTLVPDLANPQDLNRYSYVRNNPLRYADPTGHFCIPCVVVGAILVSKAIDYGWTAYDAWQAQRVLRNPTTSTQAKQEAALDLGLIIASEIAEPDDFLPIALPLDDVGRKLGKRVAKGSGEEAADDVGEGVVYLRTDTNTGAEYVGRSKNDARYLERQKEHARDNPDAGYDFEVIGRAEPGTDLRVLEQKKINEYGGIQQGGGRLENKINAVNRDNWVFYDIDEVY